MSTQDRRYKAYRKIVLGLLQVAAGLFEFFTEFEAPKPGDVIRG